MTRTDVVINEPNQWRLATPGHAGWSRTARPGDPRKYFMVSADCHANEPHDLWATRIDEKYRHRVPKVITDEHGVKWRVSEGYRPDRLRTDALDGEDSLRQQVGADPVERLRHMDEDGIDIEVIFPNKGLAMWATPDPVFAMAQCRVYNDWAHEIFGPFRNRMAAPAALATGDLAGSIAEVTRVANLGFQLLTLPFNAIGGWDLWSLVAMDEASRKHHFWVRPKLSRLPSEYCREHCGASFQEDPAGLARAEPMGLADRFMWGNDYPHHEGTWPHSAEAIERTMGHLSDAARANVLGLNAARFFGFEVPTGRGSASA